MKKFIALSLLTLATLSTSVQACSEFGYWIETPAIGSFAENNALFNTVKADVEKELKKKHFKLIPYGTYTRDDQDPHYCEILIEVKKEKKALRAQIRIEEVKEGLGETIFELNDEYHKVLNSIPEKSELPL
jgi:hypothetical protein